jgi:hypothetical protein
MEASGQIHAPAALLPRKELLVVIGEEAGWASQPVWTLWRSEKRVAPAGNRSMKHRYSSPYVSRNTEKAILAFMCE